MKILTVDDSEDARIILKKILESVGHSVEDATNGEGALEMAKKSPPDMIISDVLMPVMDGFRFCMAVKEDDELKSIPFIFYTSTYTDVRDEELAMGLGADRFITKPTAPDELIAILQGVIRDKKEGKIKQKKLALKEDKDVFNLYSERLIKKLEKKNLDLEKEIMRRKLVEEQLRESKEKYRSMMKGMDDGVYICSSDFFITYTNPAMTKILGCDVVGEPCHKAIHGFDEKCPWCLHAKVMEGNHIKNEVISSKNGKIYNVSNSPIFHTDGSISKLAIYRDITEHRSTEEQLRQAQKMEALGTLAGGIAHDFNNIMTIIIGNADFALMEAGKDGPLREEIEEIKTAGERAALLTRQLLAFSRKQIIQPEVIDLNELLAGIEKMLCRMIGEDVEFLTIPGSELWQVEMDSGQMEQVIMNLVINARDAMLMGGKLIVEIANEHMDENYFREHGIKEVPPGMYVMVSVSDTGCGMDKKTQEHIFDPFYTTKDQGKGTGLGLSMVYGIIKQNKGFIWVYSEPEQGAVFKIYLPRVERTIDTEEKEEKFISEVGGSETILVVEDDDSLRKLTQKTLQQYGYRVLAAENGEDALIVSKEYEGPIDLIVTDVVMPKIGGKETVKRLQLLYPQIKVIYMSGYTDNAIVHHGVLAPGLNFIEKPFYSEGLAIKVREVLGK